ncbi:hypothetical protein Tco_0343398 [Tanacetum coccineum]
MELSTNHPRSETRMIKHIPYTNAKTYANDVVSNHVSDEELNSIDGVGIGKLKKEIKKDDKGMPKEPNKEWKLNEKAVPHNKEVYHYLWHPTEIPHLNMAGDGIAGIKRRHRVLYSDGVRNITTADKSNSPDDDDAIDTPLVSPFPHSENDSDEYEVLNELIEYENTGTLRQERIINSLDRDDLAFECMIGFRKFTAYLGPFLPMNIILRKAYNTIMINGLEGTGKNLVAVVKDVYMFVGSFTYITDFVVLEDVGEFIMSNMAKVLMGRPFRNITKLKYDIAKGLVSFTRIFETYAYRMPRTVPRLKNFNWSKVPPLLELRQNDLMNGLRHPHEKHNLCTGTT